MKNETPWTWSRTQLPFEKGASLQKQGIFSTVDRREFFKLASLLGAAFAPLPWVMGCGPPEGKGSKEANMGATGQLEANLSVAGKPDYPWSAGHGERTMRRLIDVILPSNGPSNPGANETMAYETLKLQNYVPLGTNLGFIPPLPKEITDHLGSVDSIVQGLVVTDLDAAAALKSGLFSFKTFLDFSPSDQVTIVKERFSSSPIAPVYQFVRAACMISFLAAPFNDRGFTVIGLPPYLNFNDDLYSTGFADYSYNTVPSVGGRAAWEETVNGDIP